jgi:tRNA nucleotidyltransferase (CCA-adding enzyme)
MIIIPNPNDAQFRFKLLQACSKNFLTDPLPDNWHDLTELEQDNFLCDHPWRREASTLVQPLEHLSPNHLWQAIDNSADTIYTLLSSYNLTVDDSSIPQNL